MATGDCVYYKAARSGFSITANPTAAGWTAVTSGTGQDATYLAVFDNGHIRISFDSQSGGLMRVAVSDGTNWNEIIKTSTGQDWREPTITTVTTRTTAETKATVQFKDTAGATYTMIVRLQRGLPVIEFKVDSWGSATGQSGNFFWGSDVNDPAGNSNLLVGAFTVDGGHNHESDSGTANLALTTKNWLLLQGRNARVDFVIASSEASAFAAVRGTDVSGVQPAIRQSTQTAGSYFWFIGLKRSYTNNGSDISNKVRRLAHDMNSFEGFVPPVGVELLTNGNFETDVSGWTQLAGTWTRVTTQKKFGTASVETSGASRTLRQVVSGLTNGAKYAVSCWARTVGGSAGDVGINLIGGSPEKRLDYGKEWSQIGFVFTASGTSATVDIFTGSAFSGTAQFDGVTLTLMPSAFDFEALAPWDIISGDQTKALVAGVKGTNAISITPGGGNAGFGVTFTVPRDFSRYRYVTFWAKKISGSNDSISFDVKDSGGTWRTGPSFTVSSSGWRQFSASLSAVAAHLGELQGVRFGQIDATLAFDRLSFHVIDPAIGQKYGFLDDMQEDLGLWLKMDESGATTTPADASGNGNIATHSTKFQVADVKAIGSQSARFYAGDNISVADVAALRLNGSFSLAFWVRVPALPGVSAVIVEKGAATASDTGWRVYLNSNGEVVFKRDNITVASATGVVTAGTWVHLTYTFNSGTNANTWYANGVASGTPVTQSWVTNTSTVALNLGKEVNGGMSNHDGSIDDFRIYSRVLSVTEADALYDLGTSAQTIDSIRNNGSLVAWWKMEENTGTTVADATLNARNGTLTNNGSNSQLADDITGEDADRAIGDGTTTRRAQSLTVSSGQQKLRASNSIVLRLKKTGTPTGTATIRVSTDRDSGGVTATLDVSTLTTSYQNIQFSPAQTDFYVPNTTYYVSVTYSGGDASNYIQWASKATGIPVGNASTYAGSWTNETFDHLMQFLTVVETWTTSGKYGNALWFGGSPAANPYVEAADNAVLDITTAIAVAAWINPDAKSGTVLEKGDAYKLRFDGSGNLEFVIEVATVEKIIEIPAATITLNTWQHVAATYDGANLRIYHNGASAASAVAQTGSIDSTAAALRIGLNVAGTDLYTGRVDDTRLFSRALSAADVASLYNLSPLSMELYLEFDDAADTTANDSSGNARTGTFAASDPLWETAKFNNGLHFGGNDIVTVTDHASLEPASALTIEFWAKPDVLTTYQTLLRKGASGETNEGGYYIYTDANGLLAFQINNSTGLGDTTTAIATAVFANSTWAHVVVSWDGSNIRIYKNGVLASTTAHTGTITYGGGNLFVGGLQSETEFFDGTLDEVRIYSRALGPDEVAERHNTGQQIRTWKAVTSTDAIVLSTDAKEGSECIQITTGATDRQIQFDFPVPTDLSGFTTLSFWGKGPSTGNYTLLLTDAAASTGTYTAVSVTTSYTRVSSTLASPASGSVDLTRVTSLKVQFAVSGIHKIDAILLHDREINSGDWRAAVESGGIGGYVMKNASGLTTVASTDRLRYTGYFPTAGEYAIVVRARSATASQSVSVTVGGTTRTAALPTTAWASNPAWTTLSTFQRAAAGDEDIDLFPASGNSDFAIEVDAVVIVPLRKTAGTPLRDGLFPEDLGFPLLNRVSYS